MSGDKARGEPDAALLQAARDDPSAFTALYARHAERIHAWFARRIGWAAADLTAETFARAWLSRARFTDRRDGTALPWLLGIAANVLADTVRRDKIETRARERLGLPLDLAGEDGYTAVEHRLSPRRALREALELLPRHEREALELRVVDELPYEQVAARLAIRPAAARLRVSRALRRLAFSVPKEDL
ncbi:MAG TPA: RNA polymerase sigma factor [Gaiellaceae bacterium]